MNRERLFSIRNYVETFLWILAILFGFAGGRTLNRLFLSISAYTLIFISVYLLISYVYFKRAPTLRGSPRTGWFALFWTMGEVALVLYLAFRIFASMR
ncbi:hypothetical protein HY772_00590 [Candidatus Woesearchaeota archaeon]|nr:hypothetical protein [Candidatus Woesearchaeota archaeon]